MSTTTLHDAVNTCLSVIGESALTTANTSTNPNAVIARQIIEEVSRETQSKGWWFNTSGGSISIYTNASNDFNTNIPEEAVRYITIRSARVMQSRFLSSEELHKFSFNEEQVAFAILSARQAKESGTTTSFTAIPDTVKDMGIEEVLFLQSSAEEKLLTIRLNTELKQGEKLASEKLLTDAQKLAVDEDTKLKKVQQSDISADISIKGKQGSLVDAQTATEGSKKLDVEADTDLKGKQGSLIDTQADTEKARQADISADISIKGKQGSLVDAQTATEGSKKLDVEADTTIKGKQGSLIDEQVNTEKVRQSDISADVGIKEATRLRVHEETDLLQQQFITEIAESDKRQKEAELVEGQRLKINEETMLTISQKELLEKQKLTEEENTNKIQAEKNLLTSQKTKLDNETAYIVTEEKNYNANRGVGLLGQSGFFTYKNFRPEMRIMGFQETTFNALPAYKKKELLEDANTMRSARTINSTSLIEYVNNILRYIGEEQVTNTNESSLASEAYELMLKTNTELQSRGWWFNTETDVDVVPNNSLISYLSDWLSIELNDVPTTKQKVGNAFYLRNLDTKKYNEWEGTQKATIIYSRDLDETPQKFQEYVEVRTARLLTELYPQSGIDIQRLPKLEQELETYFKDRQNDQGNYNIFNNYDTATRVGVNRNYDLV